MTAIALSGRPGEDVAMLAEAARADPAAARESALAVASAGLRELALAAVAAGAARAVLDRCETALRARAGEAPASTGDPEGDLQRWFGMATGRVETADGILATAALEVDDELTLAAVARQAADLIDSAAGELLRPVADALCDDELAAAVVAVIALRARPGAESDDALARDLAGARLS